MSVASLRVSTSCALERRIVALQPASSAKDSRKSGPSCWPEVDIHWPDWSEDWIASLL